MDNATWADMGIGWVSIPVGKRYGDHASDTREVGHVESPRVRDLDKAVSHFGKSRVESWLNHSGAFDVRARSWFKARYTKNRDAVKMAIEDMRKAVYQSVLLASGRGRIVEREIRLNIMSFTRIIRSGEEVTYADLFGAALAANIDAMPDAPVEFIRQAVAQSLESAGFTPDEDDTDDEEVEA